MKWKDETPYASWKIRGSAQQDAWSMTIHGFDIFISRDWMFCPNDWIMICEELDIEQKVLGPKDILSIEQAWDLAVREMLATASEQSARLKGLMGELRRFRSEQGTKE